MVPAWSGPFGNNLFVPVFLNSYKYFVEEEIEVFFSLYVGFIWQEVVYFLLVCLVLVEALECATCTLF